MEEFLPLIIGFAWLAYTWYNKNQKKKQGKDNQPVPGERAPSILEQLLSGENIKVSDPEPVYEEIEELEYNDPYAHLENELPVEIEKPSPFLNSELADYTEEGQSIFGDTDNNYDELVDDETELVYDTLGDLEDFDLKKAVILSEILNAPYIDYK